MRTFIVLTGEASGRCLQTALVEKEEYNDNPEDYFSAEYTVTEEGEISVSGSGENILPSCLIGE